MATPSRKFPALRSSGEVDLDALRVGARHHDSPKVRWQCRTLLDHLDGDAAVPVFLAALRDPVPRVRRHALHALTRVRCKEEPLVVDVVPFLIEAATTDENAKVRNEALNALRTHSSDPRVAHALPSIEDLPTR